MATAAATVDVTCTDEFDSTHLSEAVHAAMMELQGTKGHQLKTATGYPQGLGPTWRLRQTWHATYTHVRERRMTGT